jgi:PPOX class probable F420-dependent enzyme
MPFAHRLARVMDPWTARALMRQAPVARLATVRADGSPHAVPICFALIGDDTIVSAVDHKPKRTDALVRLDNVRTTPAVSVLADHYDDDWSQLWWVRADGAARVVDEGPDRAAAIDALALRYAQYVGSRPTGAVLVVEVSRWSGWRATG